MTSPGVLGGYLAGLRAELAARVGSRGTAPVLAEAADHLHEAAAHYQQQGLRPAAAEQAAVEEFGPVGVVAGGFVAVVAVTRLRAAARALALGVCLLAGAWAAGNLAGPPLPWADDHEPSGVVAAQATAAVAFRVAVLATVAAVVLGRRGRHLRPAAGPVRWMARSSAVAGLALVASVGAAAVYQAERYLRATRPQPQLGLLLAGPIVAVVAAATLAGVGWSVTRAVRATIPPRRTRDRDQGGCGDATSGGRAGR